MAKKKLLDRVRTEIRRRNYSYSTEKSYCNWIVRYVRFHNMTHPANMGKKEITEFLNYLAVDRKVAASTQNQALSAIVFLYEHILNQPVFALDQLKRAKKPSRLPVVLSKKEARAILSYMEGDHELALSLMYGAGLRVSEALRIRILDLDFSYKQILVRSGKGLKDRVTMMPEKIISELKHQIRSVKQIHQSDLARGFGETILPKSLAVKYPNDAHSFRWQ